MMGAFTSIYEPMPIMQNIIIWYDGTIHPYRNHNQCTGKWEFDGQIFAHKCPQSGSKGEDKS